MVIVPIELPGAIKPLLAMIVDGRVPEPPTVPPLLTASLEDNAIEPFTATLAPLFIDVDPV